MRVVFTTANGVVVTNISDGSLMNTSYSLGRGCATEVGRRYDAVKLSSVHTSFAYTSWKSRERSKTGSSMVVPIVRPHYDSSTMVLQFHDCHTICHGQ